MTPDLMRTLVRSGANLVVYSATPDLLRELAAAGRSQVTFDPMPPPRS